MKIKFDKAVKYNGVRYRAHEVFEVDGKDSEELVKAGAIIMVADPPVQNNEQPAETDGADAEGGDNNTESDSTDADAEGEGSKNVVDKEALLEYTLPELIAFAKERNIDLNGETKKANVYNIIVASIQ